MVCVRVLVVEDQAQLADDIADGLRDQGIGADVAYDGSAGIDKALLYPYDVIVLDRDLPRVHGDAVCATLAGSASSARILMLTAPVAVAERVRPPMSGDCPRGERFPPAMPWLARLWPQRVRTRLTLIYAGLFLAGGSALLALTYGLLAASLPSHAAPTPKPPLSKNQFAKL